MDNLAIPEAPESGVAGEDLFPADEEAQKKIVMHVEQAYMLAKTDKDTYQERWGKYYKMYRSYVKKREKGDWRSRVWIPISFYVVETLAPRLVAQLPAFRVDPVGPEDAPGARPMEELLAWASDKSDLYLELVKAVKSSLMFGTGILKTSYDEQTQYAITQEPQMQETTASEVPA